MVRIIDIAGRTRGAWLRSRSWRVSRSTRGIRWRQFALKIDGPAALVYRPCGSRDQLRTYWACFCLGAHRASALTAANRLLRSQLLRRLNAAFASDVPVRPRSSLRRPCWAALG